MSTPYNTSFVCLSCQKSFKRQSNAAKSVSDILPCPECGGPSYNFGRHFKAPKRTDKQQWQKIKFLFEHGFRFQKIRKGSGHHNTIAYPETLAEAKEFVVKYKDYAIKN
jgi:DNA-directed RNA polymerase subunit RPC12/RpoP